jgi:hypothetical protein
MVAVFTNHKVLRFIDVDCRGKTYPQARILLRFAKYLLTFGWKDELKPFFWNVLIIFQEQICQFEFEARISTRTPIVISSSEPTGYGANAAMADGGKLFVINVPFGEKRSGRNSELGMRKQSNQFYFALF